MKKIVFAFIVALALAAAAQAESIVQILDGGPESCYLRIEDTETHQVTYGWYTPCPVAG